MEDEIKSLIMLMHGDLEVSTKELARLIGVKTINLVHRQPPISSAGILSENVTLAPWRQMPVYMEATILELPKVYINGVSAASLWNGPAGPGQTVGS